MTWRGLERPGGTYAAEGLGVQRADIGGVSQPSLAGHLHLAL